MKEIHKGRGIANKEFDIVLGHIVATMKELNVPEDLSKEFAEILGALRPDVV